MCIRDRAKIEPEQKNYAGSLTYIGSHTRKIIKCFNKYREMCIRDRYSTTRLQ